MHYWNQEYYETLRAVGEAYASRDGFQNYAQYCLLKERGLNKDAVKSANVFVADLNDLSCDRQRDIVSELAELDFRNNNITSLLPHPIKVFMEATLRDWVEAEPECTIAFRWLGFLTRNIEILEKAHKLDPSDEIVASRIAWWELDDIHYQTHELGRSLFVGKIGDAKNSLARVKILIDGLLSSDIRDPLLKEFSYYSCVASAWCRFKKQTIELDFLEWCSRYNDGHGFLCEDLHSAD